MALTAASEVRSALRISPVGVAVAELFDVFGHIEGVGVLLGAVGLDGCGYAALDAVEAGGEAGHVVTDGPVLAGHTDEVAEFLRRVAFRAAVGRGVVVALGHLEAVFGEHVGEAVGCGG